MALITSNDERDFIAKLLNTKPVIVTKTMNEGKHHTAKLLDRKETAYVLFYNGKRAIINSVSSDRFLYPEQAVDLLIDEIAFKLHGLGISLQTARRFVSSISVQ